MLVQYLLLRPSNEDGWLFLSQTNNSKMANKGINRIWKNAFHPEYGETSEYKSIGSHFGGPRFMTWWRVEQDLNRELVKYLRGDTTSSGGRHEPIDSYIHSYYEDVGDIYRLGV